MKIKNIITYSTGISLIIIGIIMAIYFQSKYFYAILSVGILITFWKIYNSTSEKKLFHNFKKTHHFIFWIDLIITSIIIDYIGTKLGYWKGSFMGIEGILKYPPEWAIPMVSTMIIFLIFKKIFQQKGINKYISAIISLTIFVTLFGIGIEYLNSFGQAWTIQSMPLTNIK
ncbi:MAG TPA: hypothetical protein VJ895_00360, partial [Candidatus Nanoarchaeia archaeon]|nr:hypothetical protein [Candidatus Nanoarchaeia archaeon]